MNSSEDMERLQQFDGLPNFRDLGGLVTQDGRAMKSGTLFRSGELSRVSENDWQKLRRFNLSSILDLRTDRERQSRPDRIPKDADLKIFRVSIHHEITEFSRLRLLWLLRRESGLSSFERLIRDYYHAIALERTTQINKIITTISDARNLPALIHCVGGRDRTGLVAAVIQLHVGVPRKTVIEDYLATNRAYEPLINRYIGYVRWISLSRLNPARIRQVLEARSEYLDEVLDKILATYGTIGDYLRDACHIDQRSLSALLQSLLE